MRQSNKQLRLRSSLSILSLAAFLLLGFCPLRNALIRELGGSPASSLPEYRKITTASPCEVVCRLKAIQPTERIDHLPSISLTGGLPVSLFTAGISKECIASMGQVQAGRRPASIPLYIRYRVLRL